MHIEERADTPHRPGLRIRPSRTGRTDAVVLTLHGGKARSKAPARKHQLAYLRMAAVARSLHRATADTNTAVWLVRNRVRGWNEPELDAVADARQALHTVYERHPQAGIVLVGHSLGGRVALRLAAEPKVIGICALAPWTEPDEPVEQLADTPVLIVHGSVDRVTSPETSKIVARRAAERNPLVRNALITGAGHAMLRHRQEWSTLTRRFVRALTTGAEADR